MTFLFRYWKPLAVALLLLGVWLHGDRNGSGRVQAKWDAEVAQANLDALTEKQRLDDAARAQEAAQAESTRNMEEDYAKALAADRTLSADRERSYADSLRTLTNRLGRCQSTSEALGAIVAADGAREREDRLREEVGRDFAEVGRRANELAATVRLCVAWANEVGR